MTPTIIYDFFKIELVSFIFRYLYILDIHIRNTWRIRQSGTFEPLFRFLQNQHKHSINFHNKSLSENVLSFTWLTMYLVQKWGSYYKEGMTR